MSNLQEMKRLYYEQDFKNRVNDSINIFNNCYEPQPYHGDTSLQPAIVDQTMEELTKELFNPIGTKPFFKGYVPNFYFKRVNPRRNDIKHNWEPKCIENKRYDRMITEPIPMEEPTYIVSPKVHNILKPWIDEQKRLKSYKINI